MTAFCRGFVVWAGLRVRSFDITPISDLPYLTGYWGFRLGSIPGFCRLKTMGGDYSRVMRGFLYTSMVQAFGTQIKCTFCVILSRTRVCEACC